MSSSLTRFQIQRDCCRAIAQMHSITIPVRPGVMAHSAEHPRRSGRIFPPVICESIKTAITTHCPTSPLKSPSPDSPRSAEDLGDQYRLRVPIASSRCRSRIPLSCKTIGRDRLNPTRPRRSRASLVACDRIRRGFSTSWAAVRLSWRSRARCRGFCLSGCIRVTRLLSSTLASMPQLAMQMRQNVWMARLATGQCLLVN